MICFAISNVQTNLNEFCFSVYTCDGNHDDSGIGGSRFCRILEIMAVEKKRFRMSGTKSREVPFEQLPNLPKPAYTPIDLGITHMDLGITRSSVLAIE